MHVIILAGGFATRLRPLTLTRPKPLLPILDKPLLDWIYESLIRENVKRITLTLYNMADQIIEHVRTNWRNNVKIDYVLERTPMGDGGAIVNVVNTLAGDIEYPVIVMYGDLFTTISLGSVYRFHLENNGLMTVVGVYVNDVSRYGVLEVSENNTLKKILEKPRELAGREGLVNAGIYIVSEEAVRIMREIAERRSEKISIARDIIPRLIERGDVHVYIHQGVWNDIGTPRDYFKTNLEALKLLSEQETYIDPDAKISSRAKILGPAYIGKNVVIRDSVVIGKNTIIMEDTRIEEGVYIEDSLIMRKSEIGSHTVVRGSIIGENNYIGKWVRIYDESVLGASIYISDLVCLPSRTLVLPYKEINEDLCKERIDMSRSRDDRGVIIV
ncbi:MAG: NDP-sugar synthase [Sulfolobales archaeon]